jgi:NitT/TauT family transport system permease protein
VKLLRLWLQGLPAYLWSGWGAISSLLLFMAVWEWGNQVYGDLVLPTPLAAFSKLGVFFATGEAWEQLLITGWRAFAGFILSVIVGSVLGIAAGLSMTASMMSRPIVTVLVGMPPIAWIVLALLWFGATDMAPIFTVFITCFPIVFVGAMQGARTLDNQLKDMAAAFKLPSWMAFIDVYLPHIFSYIFPAWVTALGMSWKIVVMAELLATSDGIGAALAVSRSHLDTAATMAWIVAVVGLLLMVEYLLLEPIKREVEKWRESDGD